MSWYVIAKSSGRIPSTSAARIGSAITAPVPFSWAPVTIRPLPSRFQAGPTPRTAPGAVNHQPDATPIASFGRQRLAPPIRATRRSPARRARPALVALARRALVAVADEVAPPELDRIQADPRGEHVVVLLDRPARLRPRRRAHRAGRRAVRVDGGRLDVDVGDAVGPAIIIEAIWPRTGVSEAYAPQSRRSRARRARIRPSSVRPVSRSTIIPWVTLSGATNSSCRREHEADRPPGRPREGRDVRLEVEVALAAEPAAEVADHDPDPVLRDPQDLGGLRAGVERDLGRRVDRDPVAVPLRGDAVRLDRDRVGHVRDVALAHDDRCGGERGRRIALTILERPATFPDGSRLGSWR